MNSFGNKVKYFFGLEGEEEQDFREEKEMTPGGDYSPSSTTERLAPREHSRGYREVRENPVERPIERQVESKLVICKYTPLDHRETMSMIDDVRSGRPVIINFQETEDFVAAKIINICEGAAYALDADIMKIASDIFIIVPKGVDVRSHIPTKPQPSEEANDEFDLG
ncbi:MAG: cell division protein SepF [Tissierellia bacterium]|nr:cell division protein SepF [Tissierellia bacterium]